MAEHGLGGTYHPLPPLAPDSCPCHPEVLCRNGQFEGAVENFTRKKVGGCMLVGREGKREVKDNQPKAVRSALAQSNISRLLGISLSFINGLTSASANGRSWSLCSMGKLDGRGHWTN